MILYQAQFQGINLEFQGLKGFSGLKKKSRVFQDFEGAYEPCCIYDMCLRNHTFTTFNINSLVHIYQEKFGLEIAAQIASINKPYCSIDNKPGFHLVVTVIGKSSVI